MPAQIEQRQSPSFFSKYKFTIITLCIILIALVPLLLLSRHTTPQPSMMHTTATTQPLATPTPVPLTQQNVQPTLDATDQSIQNAVNQSTQDINTANQIDTSQDSVAGI